MSPSSTFSVDHLMVRPSPMQDMKDGLQISYSNNGVDEMILAKPDAGFDRQAFLLSLSLPIEQPPQQISRMNKKQQQHTEENKYLQNENSNLEDTQSSSTVVAPTCNSKRNDLLIQKYLATTDAPRRGRLVFYDARTPWLCPHLLLAEASKQQPQNDATICVLTAVPESVWWKQLQECQVTYTKLHWEFIDGKWQSSEDRPSNYRQLASVDQDAIQQYIGHQLRSKFQLIDSSYNLPSGSVPPPFIIIDRVEDLCDQITVQKNVDAVRLYNALMESPSTRIVALSQSPCYRDLSALKLLLNLLHGYCEDTGVKKKGVKPTRRRLKDDNARRKTRRLNLTHGTSQAGKHRLLFPDRLPKDFGEFKNIIKPLIYCDDAAAATKIPEFDIERCEMSQYQFDQYSKLSLSEERHDAFLSLRCCNYALPLGLNRPLPSGELVSDTLYTRECERIVDEIGAHRKEGVAATLLEKYSPKYARVIERIVKEEKDSNHLIYTRYDLEGEIFRSFLLQQTEDLVVLREGDASENLDEESRIQLIIGDIPATVRKETVDVVHVLEPPDESLVQLQRVLQLCPRAKKAFVYVSTVSQKLLHGLISSDKKTLQLKSHLPTKETGKSPLIHILNQDQLYLGEELSVDRSITLEEKLLEDAFIQYRVYTPYVDQFRK